MRAFGSKKFFPSATKQDRSSVVSSATILQDNFEQPRRAPIPPLPPQDIAGSPVSPSAEDVEDAADGSITPRPKKSSWLARALFTDTSDASISEDAPGLISRSMLPTSPSREAKRARNSARTEEKKIEALVLPVTASEEAHSTTKARPPSLKTFSYRPSSLLLTPKSFYSRKRASASPVKDEEAREVPDEAAIPEPTCSTLNEPLANDPPNSPLPALPPETQTRKRKSRDRSRSSVKRLHAYTDDAWHRHVYAHGALPLKDGKPTRLIAESYATMMLPQAHVEESADRILVHVADLLGPASASTRYRPDSRALDSGLISEVARMT